MLSKEKALQRTINKIRTYLLSLNLKISLEEIAIKNYCQKIKRKIRKYLKSCELESNWRREPVG
jgi:hypothetical protein